MGVGTPEALAAPDCDRNRGRIKVPWHWAPPCVKPWPAGADNGGATAQGVTKDTIKVVYIDGDRDQRNCDQNWCQAVESAVIFQRFYQTWGRRVQLVRMVLSGTDEAAQRADAIQVAAVKPFAVSAEGGGPVFVSDLAKAGIISLSYQVDKVRGQALAPYAWGIATDVDAGMVQAAEFVGKGLAGRPARWAGDSVMQTQTRKFGVVLPDTVDSSTITQQMARYGVSPTLVYRYSYSKASGIQGDPAGYQQEAPFIIARLKEAGVNNVIAFTDLLLTASLTKQATGQNYNPEWTVTGFQFQDCDCFARGYDPQQWAHAFGLGQGEPQEDNVKYSPAPARVYHWYWGSTKPNVDRRNGVPIHLVSQFFAGIHLAGPRLTPFTYRDGLFSLPPSGGAACGCVTWMQLSFGRHGLYTWDDYIAWDDYAMIWWNPTARGSSNFGLPSLQGVGKYMYVKGGKRYAPGQWPTGEPPMFDPNQAVSALDGIPPSDRFPDYPCDGCPSGG